MQRSNPVAIAPQSNGTHEGRKRFKLLFKVYLYRTGALRARQMIFIGDGAPWIWSIVTEIVKEMKIDSAKVSQVLDFYHACEKFWKIIDALPTS